MTNIVALFLWFFLSALALAALWVSDLPHAVKVVGSPWVAMATGGAIWNVLLRLCVPGRAKQGSGR